MLRPISKSFTMLVAHSRRHTHGPHGASAGWGRVVASRGWDSACLARRDRDAQPAAHTWPARRAPSASAGWGGRSRRAAGTARVVPPPSRCAACGTHMDRTARALRQRRPWRAVASHGRHSACPSRRDCDAPPAAHTWAARRARPLHQRRLGGGCVARAAHRVLVPD
jgi:hypothetical protein